MIVAAFDSFDIILYRMEWLSQKESNTATKESNLCGTFVDAIIRPLIDDPDNDHFLIWYVTQ